MNAFDGILEEQNTATFDVVSDTLKPIEQLNKKLSSYFTNLNEILEEYVKTGAIPDASSFESWEDIANGKILTEEKRSTIKENIAPKKVKKEPTTSPSQSRPRRNAFKEASLNINKQSTASLNSKQRRLNDPENDVCIKKEKLSICDTVNETKRKENEETLEVKKEAEEMPAPNRRAPRTERVRSSKQKKPEEIQPIKEVRESDVIIQEPTAVVVNVESENEEKTLKNKRSRSLSPEDGNRSSNEKRSKSSQQDVDTTITSENAINDVTFVAQAAPNLNATVVVNRPRFPNELIPQNVNDMMTDDESEEEAKRKTATKSKGIPILMKQVFSPFLQSPVKQKVQAFEKLQEEATALLPRPTRTKTRAQAKKQELKDENPTLALSEKQSTNSNIKEKAKIFTPARTKFLPKAASTTIKSDRIISSSSNLSEKSLLSIKTSSALKASQDEFREHEKRRREKQALLQSQIEAKRRKREEKQFKAQQQREALEKDKLKVLDAQRQKETRHKQILAEQEKRKLKHREEQEKKRQMAKLRAIEEKKREEQQRREEQKKTEEMAAQLANHEKDIAQMVQRQIEEKRSPVYMNTKAPLLPTPDCYDSDDECRPARIQLPEWCNKVNLKMMQKYGSAAGERLKNSFFSIQAQTPDLQDIFESIEAKKLKRNSSAVWTKQPRFTMMPVLENHDETAECIDVIG